MSPATIAFGAPTAVQRNVSANIRRDSAFLKELERFLSRPQSIGLDNTRESLRNVVQLMMELVGEDTGYAIQDLASLDPSQFVADGAAKEDDEKKKKLRDYWDMLLELERQMMAQFKDYFKHTQKLIAVYELSIDAQIRQLQADIKVAEDLAADGVPEAEEVLREKKSFMTRLRNLKEKFKKRKETLKEAETVQDIADVEMQVQEDVAQHEQQQPSRLAKLNPMRLFQSPKVRFALKMAFPVSYHVLRAAFNKVRQKIKKTDPEKGPANDTEAGRPDFSVTKGKKPVSFGPRSPEQDESFDDFKNSANSRKQNRGDSFGGTNPDAPEPA